MWQVEASGIADCRTQRSGARKPREPWRVTNDIIVHSHTHINTSNSHFCISRSTLKVARSDNDLDAAIKAFDDLTLRLLASIDFVKDPKED
jgi:hypothetical protein